MSASLDHEKFANFFGSCPVLEIPGRSFPVKTVYCNHVGKENVDTPNYLTKVSIFHVGSVPGSDLSHGHVTSNSFSIV